MKIKDFLKIDRNTSLISLSYLLDKNINMILLEEEKELDDEISEKLSNIIKKVEDKYPLQYAIGRWNFYGLDLIVDPRALIPRPETEILVEKILKSDYKKDKILDIGTGTGAISLALADNLKNSKILGSDISNKAIELARENKEKLGLKNVDFLQSDLFENIGEKFDIIVSNPPYINQKDYNNLAKELSFEPKNALLGGEDGLYFYDKIIKEAKNFLNPKGAIFFEIGYDQKDDICKMLIKEGYKNVNTYTDYNDFDRIIVANI
jgi:release factor glutamine methyltransferase